MRLEINLKTNLRTKRVVANYYHLNDDLKNRENIYIKEGIIKLTESGRRYAVENYKDI